MPLQKITKILTPAQAFDKMCKYCAYQERTQHQVRLKLQSLYIPNQDTENIIAKLIENNFINELRFATTYASGKFRINKWGKLKIKHGLKKQKITPYCIAKALQSIDNQEYEKAAKKLFTTKYNGLKGQKKIKALKAASYLRTKGYESDIITHLANVIED
ncbi:MAG: RecX family transcriptional regulator [Cytophagales bacterium]|nr:RecX family transcriptional regulator [Cytophagales bacterium]